MLDEQPGGREHEHTRVWSAKVDEFDGFIFVTGEYNHTIPAALTNAIAFLNPEFNDKSAGIVSYGSMGGVRANEHLRQVLAELQVADVRQNVMLDRKSTRLNSSHVRISYAVFCLKKKKNIHIKT